MINKNRNPEKVNKLAVGSTATPADGELAVSGNVAVGLTAAALQSGGTGAHLHGASYAELKFTNTTTGSGASDGTAILANGSDFIINNREAGSVSIGTSNATALTVDSAGLATFSAGIAFQTTGTGTGTSSEAFTLDKYETGLWTPSISFGTTGTTGITYNTSSTDGIYTRIGNYVFLDFVIKLTSKGSSGGGLYIQGYPFTANNYASGTSVEFIGGNLFFDLSTSIDNGAYCSAHGGSTYGSTRDSAEGASITDANLTDTTMIRGNVKYRI